MKRNNRPRVLVNFAITADGKVSTRKFTPTGFTNPADKRRLREIRSLGDGLLAGASTVATDSMAMGLTDISLQQARQQRGQSREPMRVLVSNSGKLDLRWKVFANARTPLIIFSTTRMPAAIRQKFPNFCDLWLFDEAAVPMTWVLRILCSDYGLKTLVCEGGPRLFRSLATEGAIDELFLTIAPCIFGGSAAPTLSGIPAAHLPHPTRFRLISGQSIEGEWYGHFSAVQKNSVA